MNSKTSAYLENYRELVGTSLLEEIYDLAYQLSDIHVVHVNTAAEGGGVANLLGGLIPVMRELGIAHSWEVINLDEQSCRFMAKLSDRFQGGSHEEFTVDEQQQFLSALARDAEKLRDVQADIYYIHDVQLASLAAQNSFLRPAVWFCHIDTAHPDVLAEQFIRQFLASYELCVFNNPASVFRGLPAEVVHVLTLGIDVLAPRHAALSPYEGAAIIERCGVDSRRPIITQVSRFGRNKNPWQVIEIHRLVKRLIPDVQTVLIGAMQAADDVKAQEILMELQHLAAGEKDIHLLSNPTLVNDPVVNAFQRYSDVILQRSTHEGFGFTVTEAMWKQQPVVGTSATGVRYQIQHLMNGCIADTTQLCAAYASTLLLDRAFAQRLGLEAQKIVRQSHLLPMMIADYLKTLVRVLKRER